MGASTITLTHSVSLQFFAQLNQFIIFSSYSSSDSSIYSFTTTIEAVHMDQCSLGKIVEVVPRLHAMQTVCIVTLGTGYCTGVNLCTLCYVCSQLLGAIQVQDRRPSLLNPDAEDPFRRYVYHEGLSLYPIQGPVFWIGKTVSPCISKRNCKKMSHVWNVFTMVQTFQIRG